ncbi:putative GNAT family N-acyltransferase [Catalinimonas alkaloidigena]|uniref:hypothetical protein n=1 Tax=Catalinimonas alkaloidigena TaxID=1075417 RepID=UPI002405AEA5|nr:hypothetical protein [Catalinimonas alkaloidigena]MDF9794980.1 putative GNAT family N-acyltransferase [Catalinimonas alkaloidigena]
MVNISYGWKDSLDKEANHWVIEHEGKIIASSRLCMISNLNIIEENYHQFGLPVTGNYAFFSRLVVDSKFWKIGLAHRMDKVRLEFIRANNIELTLAWARKERLPSLHKLGFKNLGNMSLTFGTKKEIVSAVLLDCSSLVKGKALNYGNRKELNCF